MTRLFLRYLIPVLLLALWCQCANIQSPTGGPKDTRPPKLVSSIPKPNQTRYTGSTVLLTFDETVKLNNPREEIIISPSPGKEIEFQVKNNKVFITPKLPWKDSTTYSILFREGIQDITESNVPANLKLAFSTGPTIDSLVIAGNVSNLQLGTPSEKITVAIYQADTFDIFTHIPSYFTQTDKQGNFQLENLRTGQYHIYAFDDKNKNLKVESRTEMFGYKVQPIELSRTIDTLHLSLIQLDTRPLRLTSIRNTGNITRIKFNKGVVDYSITTKTELVSAFGDNSSEVNLWNPGIADSLLVEFTAKDSLDEAIDTAFYVKRTPAGPILDKFTLTVLDPGINPETGRFTTTISFSKPVPKLLLDSLYLRVDTTTNYFFTPEEITYQRKQKRYVLTKELGKKMFGPDDNPTIVLTGRKSFAISIDGDTSKSILQPVTIFWPEENAVVTIQANTKRTNYILQLLSKSTSKVIAQTINTPKLSARNIPPGEYRIRVILDTNANGTWDAGNIRRGSEPEKIIYYRAADGATQFPVRANWEVGPLLFTF